MSTATKVRRNRRVSETPAPRRIDVADVRTVLEEIAAESPDHRDRRAEDGLPARYMDDQGRPACFVARVLIRLGFAPTILKALDSEYALGEISPRVRIQESSHPALKKISGDARRLLQYIQDRQDAGLRWGRIVKDAFRIDKLSLPRRVRARKPWLFPDLT